MEGSYTASQGQSGVYSNRNSRSKGIEKTLSNERRGVPQRGIQTMRNFVGITDKAFGISPQNGSEVAQRTTVSRDNKQIHIHMPPTAGLQGSDGKDQGIYHINASSSQVPIKQYSDIEGLSTDFSGFWAWQKGAGSHIMKESQSMETEAQQLTQFMALRKQTDLGANKAELLTLIQKNSQINSNCLLGRKKHPSSTQQVLMQPSRKSLTSKGESDQFSRIEGGITSFTQYMMNEFGTRPAGHSLEKMHSSKPNQLQAAYKSVFNAKNLAQIEGGTTSTLKNYGTVEQRAMPDRQYSSYYLDKVPSSMSANRQLLLPSLLNDQGVSSKSDWQQKTRIFNNVVKVQNQLSQSIVYPGQTSSQNLKLRKIKLKENEEGGQLYVWGSIQDGQLGNGVQNQSDEEKCTYIENPLQLHFSQNVKIEKLVCGAGHTLVLTQMNQIFSWGCNLLGQLGLGDRDNRSTPTEILVLKDRVISDIASGAGHGLALDTYGVVYSWGASADFQTGHTPNGEGVMSQCIVEPRRLEALVSQGSQIMKMACGVKHTALITTKSELICFGSNEFGQCGDGKCGIDLIKKNFEINNQLRGKQIDIVACGGAHTLARTQTQEVYSFGLNDKGQLGLGVNKEIVPLPSKIKNFTSFKITKLACADESSCALTSNGDLFVWGRNKENLLGIGERKRFWPEPLRVTVCFQYKSL